MITGKFGLHQGSALSSFLFLAVFDVERWKEYFEDLMNLENPRETRAEDIERDEEEITMDEC